MFLLFVWFFVSVCGGTGVFGQTSSPIPVKRTNLIVDTISEILGRGSVLCGVNSDDLYGFSNISIVGQETGLEVSICKAYAAGLGVKPSFIPIYSSPARFEYLYNGSVDVVLDQFTDTITRELAQNATFGFPYMHDGAGILVVNTLLGTNPPAVTDLAVISNSKMCVVALSSTIIPLNTLLTQNHLNVTMVTVDSPRAGADRLIAGQCNAFAYDQSSLVTVKVWLQQAGIASTVISNPQLPFSNEPLSPATLLWDTNWSYYVREMTQALFAAEANNVTQAIASSASPVTQTGEGKRLLGLDSTQDPTLIALGQAISRAIATVGNYGEIYASTFAPYLTRSKADTPADFGGCLYYTPFE